MTLTTEAQNAHNDQLTSEAAASAAAREALQAEGMDAIRLALVRQDGTYLVLADIGVTVVYTDEINHIVVVSDQTITLVAQRSDEWSVRLGTFDGTSVMVRGSELSSLADLGAALQEEIA